MTGKDSRAALKGLLYPVGAIAVAAGPVAHYHAVVLPQMADVVPVSQWQGAAGAMARIAALVTG